MMSIIPKSVLGFLGLFIIILLGGCIASVPSYVEEPKNIGQVVGLVLRFAFIRPWLLVPALWQMIEASWTDINLLLDIGSLIVFIFFIGGIHIGIGALLHSTLGELWEFFGIVGGLWVAYGLFIWASCAIVGLLAMLM